MGSGSCYMDIYKRERVCVELVDFENRDFSTEKVLLFCVYLAICFLSK